MSLTDQLAEFDRMRGKEPTDPHHIDGAPNELPNLPPSFGGQTGDASDPYGLDDPPPPEPSPLIPRRSPIDRRIEPVERPSSPVEALPGSVPVLTPPDFAVVGMDTEGGSYVASCSGRQVVLTATERAQVRQVVLRAIAREIREDLAKVAAQLPKRQRRGKVPAVETGATPLRRGRRPRAQSGVAHE